LKQYLFYFIFKEVEQEEEMECEDLLAFASGLDYDQYINDLEV